MPLARAAPAEHEVAADERLDRRRLVDDDVFLARVSGRNDLARERSESVADRAAEHGRAQQRVARARSGDARADASGKREQQRRGSGEHDAAVAASAWPSARRITGIHCTAAMSRSRCGLALRSVERGDERVAELGHALLEPERHGRERAHAAPAPERVGACRERERDGRGDREHAHGARRAEHPIDQSARPPEARRQRRAPTAARARRWRRRVCGARRRLARAPSRGRSLTAKERLEEQQRERAGEEPASRDVRAARCDARARVWRRAEPVPRSCARAESDAGA